MPRMFVEDNPVNGESPRGVVSRLMRALDDEAAKQGHRVAGDVAILQYPASVFEPAPKVRLEADVVPSV